MSKDISMEDDMISPRTGFTIPSVIHSLPWLLGWVWISLMGPFVVAKLFAKVGRSLFKKYLCNPDMLTGKIVLITGASSGVGESLARALYQRGCRLILAARSVDKLEALKEELLATYEIPVVQEPVVLQLDITDLNQVAVIVSSVIKRMGGAIDVLINNAGQGYRGEAVNTLMEVDLKLMMVNYFGHVAVTKEVLPGMLRRGSGHILSVSSIQGRLAIPHRTSYAASKHALQGYMDCLRAEVAGAGITVSVISPGYIVTNLSLNAVNADGSNYGVVDESTASGMTPASVADHIVSMLENKQEECLLCPLQYRAALSLRYWAPQLLSYIMKKRASASIGSENNVTRDTDIAVSAAKEQGQVDVEAKKQL